MRENISLLEPCEGSTRNTLLPPTAVRLYPSSEEGKVSLVLHPAGGGRGIFGGTRLSREQVTQLRDDLSAYLDATEDAK